MAGSDLSPTLNTSGQTGASPREYSNHRRYGLTGKYRYSPQAAAWLARVATLLSSTPSVIYTKLTKYGAARVNAATDISQLP